jgi:hypothetical protein
MKTRFALLSGVLLATGLTLGGCSSIDELLEAENPAEIREDQLDDETLASVLANSVLGSLTSFYATGDNNIIWMGSMITDESVSGINWETEARISQRILPYDAGAANGMFRGLSRFRFLGDSVSGRLRNLLETPDKDRRMAITLAFTGYAYTLMAEYMCEATINVGSKLYTPVELAQLAIPKFEEAITVATAVGASADDVKNLARTGLARAALLAGDKAKVMSAAAQVPYAYNWWVEYLNGTVSNSMTARVTGANHSLGVHPRWLPGTFNTTLAASAVTDPRVQFNRTPRKGHNQLTPLYTPFQPLSYSKYNGATVATGGAPVLFDNDTDVKLASGLEAMHHYYEAAGPTGTGPRGTTLEFVNERRLVGKQTAVTLAGNELMAELRTQRFKDLWLGGFRLGDLRRYEAQGINDPMHTFPTGIHANTEWGPYGDAKCWPLPIAEYIGNPNIKKS